MNYRQQVLATWDPTLTDQERYARAFTSLAVDAAACENMAYEVANDEQVMDIERLTRNLARVRYNLECVLILYGMSMQDIKNTSIQLYMEGGI